MYQANVYTVMVASPGDVTPERHLAIEVILDWNNAHSRETGIVLLPLLWEYNTRPQMGGRPQGLINKQMVDHADLMVAIFWTRLGSSTGVAESGTVEEINMHMGNRRPTMLYFSNAQINPSAIDLKQYEKVQEYKKTVRGTGLYFEYDSVDRFRHLFTSHLAMTISKDEIFKKHSASVITPDPNIDLHPLTPAMQILLTHASKSPTKFSLENQAAALVINGTSREIARIEHGGDGDKWAAAINQLFELQLFKTQDGTWSNVYLTDTGIQRAAAKDVQVLGTKSKQILQVAMGSHDGRILVLNRANGMFITVGGNHLIQDRSLTSIAGYRAALKQLESFGLIEHDQDGPNGTSYIVTEKGLQYGQDYHIGIDRELAATGS